MKQHAASQQEGSAASQGNTQAIGTSCLHPELGGLSSDPIPSAMGLYRVLSLELNNLPALVEVSHPADPLRDTLRVLPASSPSLLKCFQLQ